MRGGGRVPLPRVSVSAPSKLWTGLAVPRSVAGAIGVSVALDALDAAMEAHVQETFQDAEDMIGSLALELLGRIQARTPVDTGRALNSWHAVMPGESDAYTYKDGNGKSFDGSIGVTAGPLEAWVGSNVDYMIYLEVGHSRQAPAGMVAVSVLELRDGLGTPPHAARIPTAVAASPAKAETWKSFVGGRMGAAMRETGSHGAAMKKLGAEWRARKT